MAISYFNPKRLQMFISEVDKFESGSAIYRDLKRSRPRWFDGRFLTAKDLNREVNYFLTRQADLAVATGTGVVEGLQVRISPNKGKTTIEIAPGHGMTFDGERVVLPELTKLSLQDIADTRELNVKLGLSERPAPPDRNRSGIYVIALRPLEFSGSPTASYPVDVDGRRTTQHGDIIEATAVTLVPYSYPSDVAGSSSLRRSFIAHQVFTEQAENQMPSSTLPLAMVELRRGVIQWLDNNMVRRDMGSVYSDVLGFGFAPRALRRSHFKQYDEMLEDVVDTRLSNGANLQFSASEHFVSLPSAGRLPTASVNLSEFTQHFFPDVMDVEMSIVPEDEMATLIEESLLLPPISLNQEEEALASNSIMIMLPVDRSIFYSYTKKLKDIPKPIVFPIRKFPSRFTPRDYITKIRAKLPDFVPPARPDLDIFKKVPWQQLVAKQRYLWYVRRRNLSYKEKVTGTPIHIMTREHQDETAMRRKQRGWNLYEDFVKLKVMGSAAADLEMVRLLTIENMRDSEILMRGALKEFDSKKTGRGQWKKLDESDAADVSLRFAHRRVGDGVKKLKKVFGEAGEAPALIEARKNKLANSLRVPELDRVLAVLPDDEASALSEKLKAKLADDQVSEKEVAKFIDEQKKELES